MTNRHARSAGLPPEEASRRERQSAEDSRRDRASNEAAAADPYYRETVKAITSLSPESSVICMVIFLNANPRAALTLEFIAWALKYEGCADDMSNPLYKLVDEVQNGLHRAASQGEN